MKESSRLHYLLNRYLDGDIDLKDQDELFELISNESNNTLIANEIEQDLWNGDENAPSSLPPYVAEDIIRNILKSEPAVNEIIGVSAKKTPIFKILAIAAAFLGLICLGYFTNTNKDKASFEAIIPQNIAFFVNNSKIKIISKNIQNISWTKISSYFNIFKTNYNILSIF
jgi:hypothetical protein